MLLFFLGGGEVGGGGRGLPTCGGNVNLLS